MINLNYRYIIDIHTIYNATNGIGIEEKTVLDVLCTATSRDIEHISSSFQSHYKKRLTDQLGGKTKRGSILQGFLMRIVNADRSEEVESGLLLQNIAILL